MNTYPSTQTMNKYLLPSKCCDDNKPTLVLDIDETLISVKKWFDECQINDKIMFKNKEHTITKLTKEVIIHYFNSNSFISQVFYFNQKNPFSSLLSPIDIGDIITNQNNQSGSVVQIITKSITLDNNIVVNNINMNDFKFMENNNKKFKSIDLIYGEYCVRFRPHLSTFLYEMSKSYEIILWTAAIRSLYSGLMKAIHKVLIKKLNKKNIHLWQYILFRDNCLKKMDGNGYNKDITLLGRDLNKTLIVDNIYQNFEGNEYNGLPIRDFCGQKNDKELVVLSKVLKELNTCDEEIMFNLHNIAYKHNFSNKLLNNMLKTMINIDISDIDISDIEIDIDLDLNELESMQNSYSSSSSSQDSI